MAAEYYVGLISGTSMDAIDAALIRMDGDQLSLVSSHSGAYPTTIRDHILPQLHHPEQLEYGQVIQMELTLAEHFAAAVHQLLMQAGVEPAAVTAIGCHGQTLCHRIKSTPPYTVQLVDNARLSVLTGIPVVGDFRRADVADGGQGAPLASLLHHALFSQAQQRVGIVNIGGIANLTVLPATNNAADTDTSVLGFDTGPGNGLMDQWCQRHLGQRYDQGGEWAAQGHVCTAMLKQWLNDSYFTRPPPKSTGREDFNLHWLERQSPLLNRTSAVDVQATLLELTAQSIATACHEQACGAVYLCGGGVHNLVLQQRLQTLLAGLNLASTAALGLAPDWVEATLFAWLAWRRWHRIPSNLPSITGANQTRILGALWLSSNSRNNAHA